MSDRFIEWLFKLVDQVAPDQDEPDLTVTLIHSNYILISDHTHFATSGFDRAMIEENSRQIESLNRRSAQIAEAVNQLKNIPVVASLVEAKNQARKASSDYGSF